MSILTPKKRPPVVTPNIKMVTDKGVATIVGRCALRDCGERATGAIDLTNARGAQDWPRRQFRDGDLTILTCDRHEAEWATGYQSVEESNRLRALCDLPIGRDGD